MYLSLLYNELMFCLNRRIILVDTRLILQEAPDAIFCRPHLTFLIYLCSDKSAEGLIVILAALAL